MTYAEVITSFYKIGLSKEDQDMINIFFCAAAHHYCRMLESKETSDRARFLFHMKRNRAHLRMLMEAIYNRGDFSHAEDKTGRLMDDREAWNPVKIGIPDPEMFGKAIPDERYQAGEEYPTDAFLYSISDSAKHSERTQFSNVGNA
jgi:hypothetical protein